MDIALKRLLMNYYYTHRSIHCLTLIKNTNIHSRQKLTPKPNKVQRIKSLNLKWHIYIMSSFPNHRSYIKKEWWKDCMNQRQRTGTRKLFSTHNATTVLHMKP